jgi:regulator of sigma E protease
MLGGIMMNLLLGWLIYSQLLFWTGDVHLPADGVKNGIHCDSTALYGGFRDGDQVLSHDGGRQFRSFQFITTEILLDDVKTVEVRRNGQPVTITLPADFVPVAIASRGRGMIDYRIPCLVGEIAKENAIKGKLQKGDVIIKVNDSVITYFDQAPPVMATLKEKDANITFVRGKDTLQTTVHVPKTGLLGFRPSKDVKLYAGYLEFSEVHYGFFGSFSAGAEKAYTTIKYYLKQFKLIFSPTVKGYKQLGGFGTMASMYPDDMDLVGFLTLTAFISLVLAVMNLLPIPMLDGGYVIMLLIEMIIRRPLNEKFVDFVQRIGFILIIGLMLWGNGNDIYRWVMTKFFHG